MSTDQLTDLSDIVRLQSQIGALRQLLNVSDQTVIEQANRLEQTLEELVIARDQAVHVSEFKSQFLASISHEIRTPLNAVIGMLDLLHRSNLDPERHEQAQIAYDSATALLEIINELLDFSKIEAGRMKLEITDFDLVQLVEGTAELLADQARTKRLAFMTFVSPGTPRIVQGDPGRLRQILVNLLGNAIKFTERGEVTLRVTMNESTGKVIFAVTDTGIGIPEKVLQHLFEPFVQADGTITRRYGGTGLGLSISKRLAELMSGRISVETDSGLGSTFTLAVPLARSSVTVAQSPPKEDLRKTRLLIVNGPTCSSEIIRAYTAAWGMRSYFAPTGESALDALCKSAQSGEPFDIAIIDPFLPDMDGLALARAIRQRGYLDSTRLIMLINFIDSETNDNALKAGFSAVLVRPVKQSSLLDCIARLLSEPDSKTSTEQLPSAAVKEMDVSLRGPVLVAEDNPVNQKMIGLQLKRLGYASHAVGNGVEAVQAAGGLRYALILMDIMMPEMDGLEATRKIRQGEALTGQHVPIVALTAHAMRSDREKCIAAGMDDYISKPITLDRLKEVVTEWAPNDDGKPFTPAVSADLRNWRELSTGSGSNSSQVITSDQQLIDLTMLRSVCSDTELHKVLDAFSVSLTGFLDNLERDIPSRDAQEIKLIVHSLLGACRALGAELMTGLCESIEQAVALERWDEVRLLTESLKLAFRRVTRAMHKETVAPEATGVPSIDTH